MKTTEELIDEQLRTALTAAVDARMLPHCERMVSVLLAQSARAAQQSRTRLVETSRNAAA